MDQVLAKESIPTTVTSPDEAPRFYQPGMLAAYCILANIPLAVFLYGVNIHRRGDVLVGNILRIVAGLGIVSMTLAAVYVPDFHGLRLLVPGIVIGIGLMRTEKPKYEKALREGARPARWWPPLLFLIVDLIIILLLDSLRDA